MKPATDTVRMEVREPRLLTGPAVLKASGYGLLSMLPVILAVLAVSVLPFGWVTLLLPLGTFAATCIVLPFGFGNPLMRKLGRGIPLPSTSSARFLVQLTFTPRLRSGPRALLEDADDIAWLVFAEGSVEFYGDSVRLSIPFESIDEARAGTIGLRGLYLYPAVRVRVSKGEPEIRFSIAERSSWLLSGARRITREIQRLLTDGKSMA